MIEMQNIIKKSEILLNLRFWCEKRDLNPYGVNHTPLKRARLPVPPLSLATYIIILFFFILSIPFFKFFEKF